MNIFNPDHFLFGDDDHSFFQDELRALCNDLTESYKKVREDEKSENKAQFFLNEFINKYCQDAVKIDFEQRELDVINEFTKANRLLISYFYEALPDSLKTEKVTRIAIQRAAQADYLKIQQLLPNQLRIEPIYELISEREKERQLISNRDILRSRQDSSYSETQVSISDSKPHDYFQSGGNWNEDGGYGTSRPTQ